MNFIGWRVLKVVMVGRYKLIGDMNLEYGKYLVENIILKDFYL